MLVRLYYEKLFKKKNPSSIKKEDVVANTDRKQVANKSGFCPPCMLMHLVKAGAVAGGTALGLTAMKQSSSMTKRTPKKNPNGNVLEQSINGKNKTVTITLDKAANAKAILEKWKASQV